MSFNVHVGGMYRKAKNFKRKQQNAFFLDLIIYLKMDINALLQLMIIDFISLKM